MMESACILSDGNTGGACAFGCVTCQIHSRAAVKIADFAQQGNDEMDEPPEMDGPGFSTTDRSPVRSGFPQLLHHAKGHDPAPSHTSSNSMPFDAR
jgi:hypothetical protein